MDRYLTQLGLSKDDAKDVVQQAFLAVWNKRAEIDPTQSLRAYLFRSGRNAGFNLKRARAREVGLPEDAAAGAMAVSEDELERTEETESLTSTLAKAIKQLPPRRREVFELCFVDGLTYSEAASVLDLSPKTIENQMRHALKALRKFLVDYSATDRL